MKKTLAMALGALMVAGSAMPAVAASHIDFSGYYRVNYMMDTNRGFTNGDSTFTDHYFDDRLLINMTFSPTDEISVHWQLRGPNRTRWGGGDKNLATTFVYGEIKQDWGTVLVGRLDDGLDAYGLATLGYQPGFGPYINSGPFDRGDFIDAVRYSNRWDNGFGLMAQYAKLETEWLDAGMNRVDSDADSDRFQVEGSYLWDGGGASLGVMYDRDATGTPYHGSVNSYKGRTNYDKSKAIFVNPAIMHSWGDFSVHFEGMAGWGDSRYTGSRKPVHHDSDGYGAYLDVDYNYGPGNVNLAGWWVSGSDLGDKDSGSLVDIVGANFYPLLVAYGGTGNGKFRDGGSTSLNGNAIGIANNGFENFIGSALGSSATFLNNGTALAGYNLDSARQSGITSKYQDWSFNNDTDANHWAVALSGNHAFTDDITMHYALAYLALNNPNYRVVDRAEYLGAGMGGAPVSGSVKTKEQDKDLGFEANLGFKFQVLDNLSFISSFGYMVTGDAYKELRGYNVTTNAAGNDVVKAKWNDGDDVYVWYNTLQFDF